MPSFTGTLPITLKHMLKDYPVEPLEPGDSLITNGDMRRPGRRDP